jgi:hypothetical protein
MEQKPNAITTSKAAVERRERAARRKGEAKHLT